MDAKWTLYFRYAIIDKFVNIYVYNIYSHFSFLIDIYNTLVRRAKRGGAGPWVLHPHGSRSSLNLSLPRFLAVWILLWEAPSPQNRRGLWRWTSAIGQPRTGGRGSRGKPRSREVSSHIKTVPEGCAKHICGTRAPEPLIGPVDKNEAEISRRINRVAQSTFAYTRPVAPPPKRQSR